MFWLVCANAVKSMGAASDTPGEDDDSAVGDEDYCELYNETEEAKYLPIQKRRLSEQVRYADEDDDEDDQRRPSSRKDSDEYEDEFKPNAGDTDRTTPTGRIETTNNCSRSLCRSFSHSS
jgi:hypothetical protein